MTIEQWSETIWVAHLADEPDISEKLISLKDQASEADTTPNLILDLTDVTRINSSNVSQMLRLRKLTLDNGARLLLVSVRDPIWGVFITTGLDAIFDFAENVPAAIAKLQIDDGEAADA